MPCCLIFRCLRRSQRYADAASYYVVTCAMLVEHYTRALRCRARLLLLPDFAADLLRLLLPPCLSPE